MDGEVDLGRAKQLIRSLSPDIVAIQEVDSGVERTGGVDQARFLAEKTGMRALFGKFMDYQGGEYGMALLSRFPIESHHNLPLPPGSEPRTALSATLRLNSRLKLTVAGIHLYRTEAQRICQAHRLVDAFAARPEPVILVGDFNSEPSSPVLSLLERFWHNPGKEGNPLTFPSDEPKREIDFVLFRPVEMFQVLESRVVDDSLTSDHRPVLLRMRLLH
jgi:endonuclease/exonuclease/phosphatase family metal-dependent hydrolase